MPAETEDNVVPIRPEADDVAAPEAPIVPEINSNPVNAVVIYKIVDEQGNVQTDVGIEGGVQPTEVQTLIELGLLAWRQKIGLKV